MSDLIYEVVKSPDEEEHIMMDEKMWNLVENRLTEPNQKEIIVRSLNAIHEPEIRILNFLLSKCDMLFSNDEIFEKFFSSGRIFFQRFNFESFWTFFDNHTNLEQQKDVLNLTKTCIIEICYPFGLLFGYYSEFDERLEIYESKFNETESQEYILSHSSDALPYIVLMSQETKFNEIMDFLKKIFQNNKNLLNEFLMRKTEPTGLNVFDLLRDYNDPHGNLKALSIFLESDKKYWDY